MALKKNAVRSHLDAHSGHQLRKYEKCPLCPRSGKNVIKCPLCIMWYKYGRKPTRLPFQCGKWYVVQYLHARITPRWFWIQNPAFLCGFCIFSMCACGFSLCAPASSHSLKTCRLQLISHSKFPVGVNVRMGCLSLCVSPVMNRLHVQGVPRLWSSGISPSLPPVTMQRIKGYR